MPSEHQRCRPANRGKTPEPPELERTGFRFRFRWFTQGWNQWKPVSAHCTREGYRRPESWKDFKHATSKHRQATYGLRMGLTRDGGIAKQRGSTTPSRSSNGLAALRQLTLPNWGAAPAPEERRQSLPPLQLRTEVSSKSGTARDEVLRAYGFLLGPPLVDRRNPRSSGSSQSDGWDVEDGAS